MRSTRLPADRTKIAQQGGWFSELLVMCVINENDALGAHGWPDRPVWGELFGSLRNQTTAITASCP
jgi:hypothetical protein